MGAIALSVVDHPGRSAVLPISAWIGLSSGISTGRMERTGATLSAMREWKTGTSRVPWPDASR